MRIQSSKVIESQMRAVGALPQVMAFAEIYQGLQTGVVDGQENLTSNIYSARFHEVQKYLTMTDHGYHGYAVITNKKFWSDLPPDIRTTLEGALKDAAAFFNNSAKKDNDDALEDIRKSGKTQIIILTPAERLVWKRAMVKVHQEWGKKLGEDILQSIYRETRFDPNTL